MVSECPVCGNIINHGKQDGFCHFCRRPYSVEMVKRGKKKYYNLKEREKENLYNEKVRR